MRRVETQGQMNKKNTNQHLGASGTWESYGRGLNKAEKKSIVKE